MNLKIGNDIIEVKRIERALNDENFKKHVFTLKEIEYCEKNNKQKTAEHYAGRFAAKEAVFKAISGFIKNKYIIEFKDIEILNDEQLRPYITKDSINKLEEKIRQDDYSNIRNNNDQNNRTDNISNDKVNGEIDKKIEEESRIKRCSLEIDVSISHEKDYAIATAIAKYK